MSASKGEWYAKKNGKFRCPIAWSGPDHDDADESSCIFIWAGENLIGMAVASTGDESIWGDDEHEANALLFGAAKDLLEALMSLETIATLKGWKDDPEAKPLFAAADKAIYKALTK